MNFPVDSYRLDGYLLAISDLKGDGTHFRCIYLGEADPKNSTSSICREFGLNEGSFQLEPYEPIESIGSGICTSFESWILNRISPMSNADKISLDRRIYDGFLDEISDVFFGKTPEFFVVKQMPSVSAALHQGAIWSVYVFGVVGGSCAIHCSWDS